MGRDGDITRTTGVGSKLNISEVIRVAYDQGSKGVASIDLLATVFRSECLVTVRIGVNPCEV
jgi:hypothetical protein